MRVRIRVRVRAKVRVDVGVKIGVIGQSVECITTNPCHVSHGPLPCVSDPCHVSHGPLPCLSDPCHGSLTLAILTFVTIVKRTLLPLSLPVSLGLPPIDIPASGSSD